MEWIKTISEIAEMLIIVGLVLWNSRLSKRLKRLEDNQKDHPCIK